MTSFMAVDEASLTDAVARAKAGDRRGLEYVVGAVQGDVFRLALRMTAHPQDAEDAAQEVLVKLVTRLDTFRGESSLRTWVYRITVRHLLDRRKSRVEAFSLDFERFGADLLDGLSAEPDPDLVMANEVKLGCTLAMLTCLDREHRIVYVLSDVFDLANRDAAAICEISDETLRQRLSRARRVLEAFTKSFCGLVERSAPCACSKRVARAEELGRVHRSGTHSDASLRAATSEMDALHTAASLMRSHPDYAAPERLCTFVKAFVERPSQLFSGSG